MADTRISSAGTPATGLDALGIVDLSDPGPSSAHPPGRGVRSMSATHSHTQQSQRSNADDHTNETLGLPPDAQVIRVPEGETYRVRAVYDFAATDESALSFHAGDVIEVLTMLPSGWWDGMLGTSRGWFPSNYVEDVDETELGDDETDDEDGYSTFSADKRFIEIAPDGRPIPRNGGSADMLGLEERGGWNDWGGADNEPSLDDVAHEVMAGREREASSQDSASGTDRARRDGTADPDETLHASHRAEREDVWVPSLTPDGRLYYHNTQTGEESWSIPGGEPQLDISANTSQNGDAISEAGGSRYGPGRASRRDSVTSSIAGRSMSGRMLQEDFRAPPGRGPAGVPHPWVARLSDDGRGWYYYNQATGETRREPPPAPNRLEGSDTPHRAHGPGHRSSHSAHNRRTQDWEDRIRSSLAPLYAPPPRPHMTTLVDAIHDAISQVYNAALAGVSADEELAVARSTHTGFALAIQHDEGAVERATSAIESVVSSVRDLVVAFGYVGPLMTPSRGYDSSLPDETMVRPAWANDMSLVGNLGLIQYMTHLAITGSRSDPNSNPWGAVMRAATKLRAVIDGMPHLLTADSAGVDIETAKGRRIAAWFGADALGDFMSGRFGFGAQTDVVLRDLDAAAVSDATKVQETLEAAIADSDSAEDGGVLEIIRATSRFREAVTGIDVAAAIDLDGDLSDMTGHPDTHHEDVRAYADLVSKARHALRELDETALQLDSAAADVYLRWDQPGADSTREELGQTVESVSRALSSLLAVAQQQAAMLEQGNVRGSLGTRSPAAMARRAAAAAHARKQSQASLESGVSKAEDRADGHNRQASGTSTGSQRTQQTTGTDAEFLEQDEPPTSAGGKRRSHRLSRHSQSASTSQTSLVNANRQSTSSSSLPYSQDPEVGTRGSNRASILKAVPSFLRRDDVGKMKSGKKLAKLLGDDSVGSRLGTISSTPTAPTAPPPPVPAPMSAPPAAAIRSEPAWYLSTDYPAGEIVFDDKGGVRAGTICALVVRLTTHVSYDNAFFQEFLLTFRSFVAPEDLIELLVERYNIAAPEGLAGEQLKEWQLRKQTPVRLRVANTIKAWLDNHYYEKEDLHALDLIEEFAKSVVATEMISRQLQQLVERKRRGDGDALSRRVLTSGNNPPPLPLLPRTQQGRPLHVLDIQPLEMARQLTIMESQFFQRIKPSECMHKAWQSPKANDIAPNVTQIILTTNTLAPWVQGQILRSKDVKMRATLIKHYINIASAARSLNNYSSMAGIVAAIAASCITRLKKTWELVSDKTRADWDELEQTMDRTKNFLKYKEMLKTINPPCVPFLGFYLSALVFIEDGNKDMVTPQQQPDGVASVPMTPTASQSSMPRRPSVATSTTSSISRMSTAWSSNGSSMTMSSSMTMTANGDVQQVPPPTPGQTLINFHKRHMTADILRDIQQYQSQPYNLAMCKPVYQFIEQGIEKSLEDTQDMYDLSLAVEPKDVGNSNRI